MLSLFLIGFILFSIFISTLVAGPGIFNPTQTQVTNTQTNTYLVNSTNANGTIVLTPVTNTTTTYTYENTCDGHGCSWWLARLVLLLAVIALSLFTLAYALSVYGVAVEESMMLRSNFARSGVVNTAIDVVRPPFAFLLSLLSAVLGLWAILVAVIIVMDVVVGRHHWLFIATCVILGLFAFLAGIVLLFSFLRGEAAIVVQPVYAAVPVQAYQAPIYQAPIPAHRLSVV